MLTTPMSAKGRVTVLNDNPTEIVREAIEATDPVYWKRLCASRAGADPTCAGSYYPRYRENDVDRFIRLLEWEHYTHAAVDAPVMAFLARQAKGFTNIEPIGLNYTGKTLKLEDPKDTGFVEAVLEGDEEGMEVDFTVIIIGTASTKKNVVFTFHPGDPIRPSKVKRLKEVSDGLTVDLNNASIREDRAQQFGFEWMKRRVRKS